MGEAKSCVLSGGVAVLTFEDIDSWRVVVKAQIKFCKFELVVVLIHLFQLRGEDECCFDFTRLLMVVDEPVEQFYFVADGLWGFELGSVAFDESSDVSCLVEFRHPFEDFQQKGVHLMGLLQLPLVQATLHLLNLV